MKFLVSKTFSETNEESVQECEFSDSGFETFYGDIDGTFQCVEFNDIPLTTSELIEELRVCTTASCYPLSDGAWFSTEPDVDMHTGVARIESIQIKHLNGSRVKTRNLRRFMRLARIDKYIRA